MNITVYLGSSLGNDPIFEQEIVKLGHYIGDSGHTLVYGGSASGLMGILADAVLESNGKVIGVEPKMFVDAGYLHPNINELIVTDDLASRRSKMMEMGDVFIAFPGGTGTLDEISEIMTNVSLGIINKPCIIYNLDNYYEGLKIQVDHMIEKGLLKNDKLKNIYFLNTLDDIKKVIENH